MNLIPSKIIRTESNAERKMFALFGTSRRFPKSNLFHSLNLADHSYKREGEIDFLIVGPEGLYAIEVKGGRVSRRGDRWIFTNRMGIEQSKKESPFEQAKSAVYSLHRSIVHHLGDEFRSMPFGYGVAFPDIEFDVVSPEWSPEIVFDSDDLKGIDEYLERLYAYWNSKTKNANTLSNKQIQLLVEFLRGEFETIKHISADVRETEAELIKLTKQQVQLMASIQSNHRIWIEGAAGTGKTLIAYEQIRRLQQSGIKTVYLCYNRLLASYLKTVYDTEFKESIKHVTISTVHNLFISNLDLNKQIFKDVRRDNNFYSTLLPQEVLNNENTLELYDHMIIDESQDIFTQKYIEALGQFINGGWENGKWSIFLDIENQKNLYEKVDPTVIHKLTNLAAVFHLNINCRNTHEIALEAELVSGLSCASSSAVEGLPVKRLWYGDDFEQALKTSKYINEDLLSNGVRPQDIVILSAKNAHDSLVGTGRLRLNKPIREYENHKWCYVENEITSSTISSFKGLEKPIVIITDIDTLEGEWATTINYVGFTRASSLLVICVKADLKNVFKERALAFISKSDSEKKS